LDVIEGVFEHIFNGIAEQYGELWLAECCQLPILNLPQNLSFLDVHWRPLVTHGPPLAGRELGVIKAQYPFEMPVFKRVRLTYEEGIKMLQEGGYPDVSHRAPDSVLSPHQKLRMVCRINIAYASTDTVE
jgi:hypothetical protein